MIRRLIYRRFPAIKTAGLGKGVYRDKDFSAFVLRIPNGFVKGAIRKVKPGKMPRVGIILKTHVNGIGAVINRGF